MNIVVFIVIQVVTFGILVFLFQKMTSAHSAQEEQRLRNISNEISKKTQLNETKLKEAEQQAKQILAKATEEANAEKAKILQEIEGLKDELKSKAREEADQIIQQANNSKKKIKEELVAQNQGHVIEQAVKLLRQVLSSRTLSAVHRELVNELIEQMNSLDAAKLQIQADKGELISPFEVDPADKQRIVSILTDKIGKPVALDEVTDKELVGGVCIKLDSLIIDGSLAKKLNNIADNA